MLFDPVIKIFLPLAAMMIANGCVTGTIRRNARLAANHIPPPFNLWVTPSVTPFPPGHYGKPVSRYSFMSRSSQAILSREYCQ